MTTARPGADRRYDALACDYDGTLATDGLVGASTVKSMERAREAGLHLILVTGRELGDLRGVFRRLDLFEQVVAENGALLYRPRDGAEQQLGQPPPPDFAEMLRARGAQPLSVGRVIVATRVPYDRAVREAIRELRLERQVIFNKGAVMVLPVGIDKASGLRAALTDLGLVARSTVGVGDAENDLAFLTTCGLSVAVANALPIVKGQVDLVTGGARGAGVEELVDRLLATRSDGALI